MTNYNIQMKQRNPANNGWNNIYPITTDSNVISSSGRPIGIKIDERMLSVKDFGAKGDGITDDTTAIQNAFNYAKANGSVKLFFPEGTYLINNYIQVYKNTTAIFHFNAVVKRIGSYFKMFANGKLGNATYVSGGYNGDGNIHFIGGTFDLNCQAGSSYPLAPSQTVSFFDLGHAENVSFEGITVKNGQIGHYFQVSSMKNVRFKNCWFGDVNYTGDGSNYDYELIQIEMATSTSFPSFGVYDNTISRDILIENCTFSNVIRAIGTHSDGKYGGSSVIYCENIRIINCDFDTSFDNMLNITAFKDFKVKGNLIKNAAGFGINFLNSDDGEVQGNIVISIQKSGMNLISLTNSKIFKNYLKDICLTNAAPYSAIRLTTCANNNFEDDTVTSTAAPNFHYAWYSSDGCTGNKIISHNYSKGTVATISGADDTEKANFMVGGGQVTLFDGDLSANGNTGTLIDDIRNFSFIVVIGNDNSSTTASMSARVITKAEIIYSNMLGPTGRFRLICDDSNSSDRVDFSFPNGTTIQADAISGTCHIRRVIGVI